MTGYMFKFCFILCLAVVLAAPAGWAAASDESEPHICFRSVDRDQDDRITPAELKASYPDLKDSVFAELDKDGDNLLSHDEYHWALGHGSLKN